LASGYLITGGLHIDGLMDTFDGIFAGKKKRLKAMKDSKVGSFGVQALVFITLIQIACILKIQNLIIFVLPICLFWGRFSNLFFIEKFKYMSYKKKSISHKKFWNGFKKESLISIFFLLIFISEEVISKPLLINQLLIWEEEENIASITQKSFPGRIKSFRGILVPPNKAFRESKINDFPEPESPVMIFKPFSKLISIISINAIFTIFKCINMLVLPN